MSPDSTTTRRVAVPSEHPGGLEARRSGHFGRCDCFTVVDVVDGAIGEVEVIANPPHVDGGCMAPVLLLGENQVDAIVVDGIGGRPLQGFMQVGIAVHAGTGEAVRDAVRAYAAGELPLVGPDRVCRH